MISERPEDLDTHLSKNTHCSAVLVDGRRLSTRSCFMCINSRETGHSVGSPLLFRKCKSYFVGPHAKLPSLSRHTFAPRTQPYFTHTESVPSISSQAADLFLLSMPCVLVVVVVGQSRQVISPPPLLSLSSSSSSYLVHLPALLLLLCVCCTHTCGRGGA